MLRTPARPVNGLAAEREDDAGRAAGKAGTRVRRGTVVLVVAAVRLMLLLLDLDRFAAVEYQVEFVERGPCQGAVRRTAAAVEDAAPLESPHHQLGRAAYEGRKASAGSAAPHIASTREKRGACAGGSRALVRAPSTPAIQLAAACDPTHRT